LVPDRDGAMIAAIGRFVPDAVIALRCQSAHG
jgi:hypothetical protein